MNAPKSIEQIIAEVMTASEQGQPVHTDAVVAAYPQFAQELTEFFQFHDEFLETSQAARRGADSTLHPETETPSVADTSHSSAEVTSRELPRTLRSEPPKVFGDYDILEEIDRGGMGVVYRARHRQLGRIVALKLIRSGELASDAEIQRFRSEAEAAATLNHPGIVPIYEVGMLGGLVFYTMAYIDGQSLSDLVLEGPMAPMEAARIVHKLCSAVDFAHRAGVYHRDIKPANVLIDASGQPILIDFGLAKFAHRDSALTTTGQILGTPAYIAPEHASGRASQTTEASDVYSLGAILYCLCAGQPPFSGPTPFDVLIQVLDRDPPKPSKLNRRVTTELDHICLKTLEKDPAHRYATASELASELQKVLQGQPIDCPQPSLLGRIESWWRREPLLVVHACGIGGTTAIVAISHWWRGEPSPQFQARILLLCIWLATSFIIQYWVVRARWRDLACLTWVTIDVTIYTTLVTFAASPRSMLLIGYPMLIVASSLFYRKRFVMFTTAVCICGFLMLEFFVPLDDVVKLDFIAIFISGLGLINLALLSTIRRVRSMSVFYEQGE